MQGVLQIANMFLLKPVEAVCMTFIQNTKKNNSLSLPEKAILLDMVGAESSLVFYIKKTKFFYSLTEALYQIVKTRNGWNSRKILPGYECVTRYVTHFDGQIRPTYQRWVWKWLKSLNIGWSLNWILNSFPTFQLICSHSG